LKSTVLEKGTDRSEIAIVVWYVEEEGIGILWVFVHLLDVHFTLWIEKHHSTFISQSPSFSPISNHQTFKDKRRFHHSIIYTFKL
jgi:hypothetical protein